MEVGRNILTIVFIVLTLGFLWASEHLSRSSAWIPQAVLAVTLTILLLQLVMEQLAGRWAWGHRGSRGRGKVYTTGSATGNGTIIPALAWIAALPFAVWLLGIAIGSGLFGLGWMRWHAGERWPFSLTFALALIVGLQLVFGILLRAELYTGVLLRLVS